MGGSVRDHRAGLTLHGPVLAISAGPGRSWQTGRSLSIDGYALSLCLGFRVCPSENARRPTLTQVLSGAPCYGDHVPTHP